MKKGNKFLEITLCLMMMLLLVGCENKKVITLDTFKEKATSNNYIVSDVTSQFKKSKIVKTATTANNLSKWVIEFYTLKSDSDAEYMFDYNKDEITKSKSKNSKEVSISSGNFTTYSLIDNGYYIYLCKVDDTLLYTKVKEEYKEEVDKFIQELGY